MTDKEVADKLVENFLAQLGHNFSDMKHKYDTMGGEFITLKTVDFLDLVDMIEEEIQNYQKTEYEQLKGYPSRVALFLSALVY